MFAASADTWSAFHVLLENNGTDVYATDDEGMTALDYCTDSYSGHLRRTLLDRYSFAAALDRGDLPAALDRLRRFPTLALESNSLKGYSPLTTCIRYGCLPALEALLEHQPLPEDPAVLLDLCRSVMIGGRSPYYDDASTWEEDRPGILRVLLSRLTSEEVCEYRSPLGSPLLTLMYERGGGVANEEASELTAALLDAGADVHADDQTATKALHKAAAAGNLPLMEALVRRGGSVLIGDWRGRCPLDLIASDNMRTAALDAWVDIQWGCNPR
jgi:ankyrin repeat protein